MLNNAISSEKGYYIEVQHSSISDEEKTDRERFYKDLVWVIDGSRRKRDYKKFFQYAGFWMLWPLEETQQLLFHKNAFPAEWEYRPVPVIFDWRLPDDPDNNLVLLYPQMDHSEPLECCWINRAIFQSMMRRIRPNERFTPVSWLYLAIRVCAGYSLTKYKNGSEIGSITAESIEFTGGAYRLHIT